MRTGRLQANNLFQECSIPLLNQARFTKNKIAGAKSASAAGAAPGRDGVLETLPSSLQLHPDWTSRLKTSPGSHSANTSKGRQHTSQSVVNRCDSTLVSITNSNHCPQNGHWMFSETCIGSGIQARRWAEGNAVPVRAAPFLIPDPKPLAPVSTMRYCRAN